MPTSFPRIFDVPDSTVHVVPSFSSLITSANSSSLFSSYGKFVEICARRHTDIAEKLGLEQDELRELRNELWALEDEYKGDEDGDKIEEHDE